MQKIPDQQELMALRRIFETSITLSYDFRKNQLQQLREGLIRYEQAFYESLYKDLRKSKEEVWATELGMVHAEIREALRDLKRWMAPERVGTNLVNMPSGSRIVQEPLGVVGFQLLRNCEAAASSRSLLVTGAVYEACMMWSRPS